MMIKNVKKLSITIFGILMALTLLLQNNSAAAAGFPLQKTSFLSATNTTSKSNGDERSESYKIPNVTSTSLWFSNLVTDIVVRTHNDPSVVHLTGGKVEITVRQEGTGGLYKFVDGVQKHILVETLEEVTTATQQYSVLRYTIDYNSAITDKEAPYTIFTSGIVETTNPGSSTPYTRYETNVYIYWDHSDLPSAPTVSFAYDTATDKMVLSGVNSTMEYRLKSATANDWQPCTNETMYFNAASTADTIYYVRYAENGSQKASQLISLTLPGKRPAPSATYDTTAETIRGLSTAMEIQFGNGSYAPLTATTLNISDIVDTISANETLSIKVRYAATATKQAGLDKTLAIFPRTAKPTTLVFDSITTTLTGYTTTMQYQTDTDTGWRSMSGTSLSLINFASAERDVTVYVRSKPTTANAASLPVEITISKLLAGPTGTLEFDREIISGLANASYQYSLNGSSWTNLTVTDRTWNISALVTSSARTLYLRAVATTTTPITANTTFAIPRRPVAPSMPAFVYNDASYPDKALLMGLTSEMEYRPSTTTTWTAATGTNIVLDIPAASVTYYVRYAATNNSFSSANKTLTLSKPGTAPSAAYNATTELVTSLNANTMEMKIGTGVYTPIEAGTTTYDMASLVNDISAGSTLTVTVRQKATATTPASAKKVLTIYSRLTAPTTVRFNSVPLTLTGYTTAMQYRLDSDAATSWRAMSGTTLSLETFASAERDVNVYVRMKPTTTASASKTVQFVIPRLLAGPTGTVDYANEAITGLTNGSYHYSINGTTWTTASTTNGSCDISSLITTSARTIYLRRTATTTTPITANTTFAIPRRPVAPRTPAFVYNDASYPDKALLMGLTSEMEYRPSTTTTWTAATGTNIVLDIPAASVTYYVRYAATDSSFSSANKTLTLVAMPAAPSITYTASTETLSKLSTAYEISFDDGAYTALISTTYNLSEIIDNIPAGGILEVNVRRKATTAAPASLATTIIINARVSPRSDFLPELQETPDLVPEDLPALETGVETLPEVDPTLKEDVHDTPIVEDVPNNELEDVG